MLLSTRQLKRLYAVLSKLGTVFNEFYLFRNGTIVSDNVEKPYLIDIHEEYVNMMYNLTGDFKIIHMKNLKEFKRCMKDLEAGETLKKPIDTFYRRVTEEHEIDKICKISSNFRTIIGNSDNWLSFRLSDDPDENLELMQTILKYNRYIEFTPKEVESPPIIFTKSLIPLVTEKNYNKLFYAIQKERDDLYILVFDFQFELFRLQSVNYYIPMEDSKK